jgi:hypothetical protein
MLSRLLRISALCSVAGLGLCLIAPEGKAATISINTGETAVYTGMYGANANTVTIPSPPGGLPTGGVAFTPVIVNTTGFPIGTGNWLDNSSGQVVPGNPSNWISDGNQGQGSGVLASGPNSQGVYNQGYNSNPFSNSDPGSNSSPVGYFYYTTTFQGVAGQTSLAGGSGLWATDNNGITIFLNGHNEGNVTPTAGFTQFYNFTVNSADFVTGTNYLTFEVFNEQTGSAHHSPTGLNVVGTINVIPEPSTMVMAGLGALIGGFAYLRRRRASKA